MEPRGYVIVAQGETYHPCARALAKSIKYFMPDASVTVMGDCVDDVFDHCIPFTNPESGFRNDWQIYNKTPYHETIRLETDMILNGSIEHWWEHLCKRDLVVTTGCRNYYNQQSPVRAYRRHLDENKLPDVYNAITYWRQSRTALQFSKLVRNIMLNWADIDLKLWDHPEPDTDTVYAIAVNIMGVDKLTIPNPPAFVHMKKEINYCAGQDWTKELVWELNAQGMRINTMQQTVPTHYYIKSFAHTLEEHYDKLL